MDEKLVIAWLLSGLPWPMLMASPPIELCNLMVERDGLMRPYLLDFYVFLIDFELCWKPSLLGVVWCEFCFQSSIRGKDNGSSILRVCECRGLLF